MNQLYGWTEDTCLEVMKDIYETNITNDNKELSNIKKLKNGNFPFKKRKINKGDAILEARWKRTMMMKILYLELFIVSTI